MTYTIKAHPTKYSGVEFRSRLEARWAAFFDLAEWKWEYEPFDFQGWTPDFFVSWPCKHSDCNGSHSLLVEVKPYTSIDEFKDHQCMNYFYGAGPIADSSAAFGYSPKVTYWEMGHGAGGGCDEVPLWIHDWEILWKRAGDITRYRKVR